MGRRVWHGEEGVVIVVNGRRIHACCVQVFRCSVCKCAGVKCADVFLYI